MKTRYFAMKRAFNIPNAKGERKGKRMSLKYSQKNLDVDVLKFTKQKTVCLRTAKSLVWLFAYCNTQGERNEQVFTESVDTTVLSFVKLVVSVFVNCSYVNF